KAAAQLGINLVEHDFTDEYFVMMKNPRYGFGGNMNPCIDCHGLMLRTAHGLLEKNEASFLVTGEVLGERPMSQTKGGLNAVLKLSADRDLILRPLSAKLLAPTKPERKGWVDRDKLYDFSGRGRKRQENLAKSFGIRDYPQPAGGCLLTEPNYSARLKELLKHEGLVKRDVELLAAGRHFRLAPNLKLAVGRNKADNETLLKMAGEGDLIIRPDHQTKGPVGLLRGSYDEHGLDLALQIVARYCDVKIDKCDVKIDKKLALNIYSGNNQAKTLETVKPAEQEVNGYMI
ncbi:tRNA 4-thiouridine(8) synthase ThiI, partial [candidate division TA06 bacterium]|nr:tRNA 4-thiouridine(8) synthase ThiI [candidate division TA06 bacterium]